MGRTYRKRKQGRQSKTSHPDTSTEHDGELSAFCVKNGCKGVKSLRPYTFHGCGRGLQTLKSLNPGDKIIEIPKHLLITTRVALSDLSIRSKVQSSSVKPTPVVLVCAFLLQERSKGNNSQWYNYLQSVPQDYTTLICMSEHDVDLLDSALREKYEAMLAKVRRSWSELQALFSDLFSSSHVVFRDFLWAWHVINTRSVYYTHPAEDEVSMSGLILTDRDNEDNFALAPYLDLLNHTDTAQVDAGYNPDTGCYQIITYDSYNKYEQVFISYGAHDNRFLLLEYGFCISGNTNNFVNFTIVHLTKICNGSELTQEKLASGLKAKNLDRGLLCDREGLSWNLTEALRVMSSGGTCGRLSVSEMAEHLLTHATDTRKQLITTISQRIREHNKIKRTSVQLFILEMLHVLYQDELELLEISHVT